MSASFKPSFSGRVTEQQRSVFGQSRAYIYRTRQRSPPVACASQQSEGQFLLVDVSSKPTPYETVWAWQKKVVDDFCSASDPLSKPDVVFLVQHDSVFTLGAGSTEDNLKFNSNEPPYPLFRTERGGEVTYHGPGQIVMYPILNLKRHQCDLHWYLRQLEEVVIYAIDQVSGLKGGRIQGLTGVWVDGSKIAAIGVRAKRWVTYHGLALNIAMDLSPYSYIVPCGISDRPVACVKSVLGASLDPFAPVQGDSDDALMLEYRFALIDSFEHIFGMEGVHVDLEDVIGTL